MPSRYNLYTCPYRAHHGETRLVAQMPVPTRDKNVPRRVHHYNVVHTRLHVGRGLFFFFSVGGKFDVWAGGFFGPYLAIQTYSRIISWLDGTPIARKRRKPEKKTSFFYVTHIQYAGMQWSPSEEGERERERREREEREREREGRVLRSAGPARPKKTLQPVCFGQQVTRTIRPETGARRETQATSSHQSPCWL